MRKKKTPPTREQIPIPENPHPQLTDAIIIAFAKMMKDATPPRGSSGGAAKPKPQQRQEPQELVPRQEFLKQVVHAVKQMSPEEKALLRQKVLEYALPQKW